MKYRMLVAGLLMAFPAFSSWAQRAFTPDDLVKWERITRKSVSDDGRWVAVQFAPWQGDSRVEVYTAADGKQVFATAPAGKFDFASSSRYLVMEEVPSVSLTDSLKLRKVKADKMPMNVLVIRDLQGRTSWKIDSLKSYRLAGKADWIAYQQGRKDSVLYVASLDGTQRVVLPNVSAYGFSPEGASLYFVTRDTSKGVLPGLYGWMPGQEKPRLLKEGKGVFNGCTFDKRGHRLAFLYAESKQKTDTASSLWLSTGMEKAGEAVTATTEGVPAGWVVSPNGTLTFSEDGSRLFLGTAPKPLEKDTTILDVYRPKVQVWSWDEPVQYTVQQYNLKKEQKRTYRALYQIAARKLIQLADTVYPEIQLAPKGTGDWALIAASRPYSLASMWEGRTRSDYCRVSLADGRRQVLSTADYTTYRLSPTGRYAYGYCAPDSCWYTLELATGKKVRVTAPLEYPVWDEENDVPDYPAPYGVTGWTEGDSCLLVNDRYDIWAFDPKGQEAPRNLTCNGRTRGIRYTWIDTDPETDAVSLTDAQLLTGFCESTKATALYRATLGTSESPLLVMGGDYRFGNVQKAADADRWLYTRERFEVYPDVWSTDASFRKPVQLTHGICQQEAYRWGTAELVSWTSFDGVPLEGVLYKPAGFDPSKKYPMIVNFYERNSETLYQYHTPEAHRSTIDYHLYLSNGYLVFNPDIRYRDGYPGESCYNCLMPGVAAIEAMGFVDSAHIGAQGHSWGGYQVAYLATRTGKFAAIESGAPVVNMFSAYGGIRWGSGLNRSFQYEHTQSRLGATPWSGPIRYFENSPLFLMDKVTTPILIMHNDSDGHVPWYQGIEFFVAMKRLQKPAWMLNYTGEPHWPMRLANKLDFQKRMFQFFNHYLKGEPMPSWMKDGLPAVKQPYELGY